MGIPGFNVWFSENYAKAYIPLGKVRVDHLYIDLNSVLHTVMRRARNHNHFHKMLHKRLHAILDIAKPTKSVMIAVDGPAPLAKLLTQRDRRKKTGRRVDDGETLTGVAITPGTTFMLDLTHSLTYYCCVKMSGKRFRHLVFELSDGTVKGEGEVKVLGRLARHWYPEDPNDTHVILGDDADLILMALTSYKENLYVANSGLNDGKLDARVPVFAVNLLHQQWATSVVAGVVQAGQAPLESALLHAKLDLTLIAIMAKGNDYLPGLRGVRLEGAGQSGLWPAYQAAVSKRGPGGKAAVAAALRERGSVTSIDPATGTPRLDAAALAALLRLAGAGGGGGPGSGGGADAEEWRGSKAAADPEQYLRGCVWLLQMYLTGQCPDYRFYYDGVAPTAAAIRAACEAAAAAGRQYISLDTFGTADPRAGQPLLPVACALALLPANCRHLAAPCVRHLMEAPSDDGGSDGSGAAAAEAAFDEDLYDELYGDCSECKAMAAEVARLSGLAGTAKGELTTAAKRLEAVQQGTAPLGEAPEEELQAEAEEARLKYESAKSQLVALEGRRKQHIASAHPYRRFPVEKLEAAAEAALSERLVGPDERPATTFGRPVVLRAFDSRPEAANFIRAANRHSSMPYGQHQQQYQQYRGASTWGHHRPPSSSSAEYASIYTPPPPPFSIENPAYFAAIVRQQVLYDEYGSAQAVQLRLAPPTPDEAVQYLSQPEAAEQQLRMQRQQQRVELRPPPKTAASAAVGTPPAVAASMAAASAAAAAAATAAAMAAVATAAMSAAPAEQAKRPRKEAAEPFAAVAVPATTTVSVVAVGAAAAASPSEAKRRGRKPNGGAHAAAGAATDAASDQATASAAAAAAIAVAGVAARGEPDVGNSTAGGDTSGVEQGQSPRGKRGRPKGSKNKPKNPVAAEAITGMAAVAVAAEAEAAAGPSPGTATVAAAVRVAAAPSGHPPPSPPMPSSRLMTTAAAGSRGMAPYIVGAPTPQPYAPQPMQPQPNYPATQGPQAAAYQSYASYGNGQYGYASYDNGQYGYASYGNGQYGYGYSAPPSSGYHQAPGGQAYGAYGNQRTYAPPPAAAYSNYAGPTPCQARASYRPSSLSIAAAAAAAAATPGRGRTTGATGPRWT